MLAILAPSKTQAKPEKIVANSYKHRCQQPIFLEKSCEINHILRKLSDEQLQKAMKLSDKLLATTKEKINTFNNTFNEETSSPAIFTFKGDCYDAIKPLTWDKKQFSHAQSHIAILSGQYGILRFLDLMQPYRLEMGLKLKTEYGTNLYQFWGDLITDELNRLLEKTKEKTIINLASAEYSKAIITKKLQGEMIEVTFKQNKDNKLKTIPIYSKRARGAMANFIVSLKLTKTEQLKDFNEDGYIYDSNSSTESQLVFCCKL
ncbi:MAG: peroxide stress protein YaaA [Desulfotalea sp.]